MDSLLASYGSSDDEEVEVVKEPTTASPPPPSTKPSSFSLPPPKAISSSLPPPRLFSSLPPPKSHNPSPHPPIPSAPKTHDPDAEEDKAGEPTKNLPFSTPSNPPSSIFSSLPPPKTSLPPPKSTNPTSLNPKPKRVVQFTPPLDPSVLKSRDEDDDEDDAKERKPSKDSSLSAPSKALSSMLPAPKNFLCLAPAPSSAASRRSALQADVTALNPKGFRPEQETTGYENYADVPAVDPENYDGSWTGESHDAAVDGSLQTSFSSGSEASGWVPSYGVVGDYAGNWSDGSVVMAAPEIPEIGRIVGKRGRKEIPAEIVEVKQDELIKNRPREDQTKLTGITFGPSYQPVSSSKGAKPSKLHKRKHQIGSLFFDMKQKEMELAERRSRGFLTKAETQAKYGW